MRLALWFVAAVVTSVVLSVATVYVTVDRTFAVTCTVPTLVHGKWVEREGSC